MSDPKLNPLPKILELIPYSEVVLDLDLVDTLRNEVYASGGYSPEFTNSYIKLLLLHLAEAKLVEMQEVTSVVAPGKIIFIKRL